jgi:hypothetical protein
LRESSEILRKSQTKDTIFPESWLMLGWVTRIASVQDFGKELSTLNFCCVRIMFASNSKPPQMKMNGH